jgi:hypothetical protein
MRPHAHPQAQGRQERLVGRQGPRGPVAPWAWRAGEAGEAERKGQPAGR